MMRVIITSWCLDNGNRNGNRVLQDMQKVTAGKRDAQMAKKQRL